MFVLLVPSCFIGLNVTPSSDYSYRLQIEYYPDSWTSSGENSAPIVDESHSHNELPSLNVDSLCEIHQSKSKSPALIESSSDTIDSNLVDNSGEGMRNIRTGKCGIFIPENIELVCDGRNANLDFRESCSGVQINIDSTTNEELCLQSKIIDPTINLDPTAAVVNSGDSSGKTMPLNCSTGVCSTSAVPELEDLSLEGESIENHWNAETSVCPSDGGTSVSDSLVSAQLLHDGDAQDQEATTSGPSFSQSSGQHDLGTGIVLHADMVSISSNVLSTNISEISNREARRNSRRLFWDAFSRRNLRRHSDSPTMVFTTGHDDDLGSHERWLLDLHGDLRYEGIGRDFRSMGTRRRRRNERRWQLRSEEEIFGVQSFLVDVVFREHSYVLMLRRRSLKDWGDFEEGSWQTTFCASGLHPDGTCSCESFFTSEESSTRASISRIVLLAEALFEDVEDEWLMALSKMDHPDFLISKLLYLLFFYLSVLDEIHSQPMSFSLSMLSLPAPESVVNSFLIKDHKNDPTLSEAHDVQQCYICLSEYEEGDKIWVLPCRHEFHMPCIDKWLKEIHGVCPLCRGDVCGSIGENSSTNPEVASL
ncbi:Zinc finger, RING-type [Dillenia turbinata]|uniref:Zinc finger, RING-type n=1 Tax=Dillenia turbinata TaxID=194707 RepID=A0AAN8V2W1_9MAGN